MGLLISTSLLPRHIEGLTNDKSPPLFGVSSSYVFLKRHNTSSTVGRIVTVDKKPHDKNSAVTWVAGSVHRQQGTLIVCASIYTLIVLVPAKKHMLFVNG